MWSFVRSKCLEYGIIPPIFEKKDFHIHVPEGATPKDGPSAGIGMVTSIVSSITNIPVRRDVAMTGEVTLTGQVLPIGGLKEKLLAAHRAGIKKVLILMENKKDLVEVPKTVLESVAPHFKYNLDLGFVYGIGEFLIVVLNFFHSLVGDWGFAIVLLTLLFKLLLSPLQIMQINSMVKMRKLQPKIQEIQDMHKNDQQKIGMEMMQLYKKEKFNPLAGCFPMIPQIPIFLAMFWVTREAFEFRGASFLWIPDLAESDPYMIAPVLMGLMMYLSQMMMPKPPQTQGMQAQISRQMMIVFPPMLTLIFLFMPAGVVIYSVINMALSIVPQALILRSVDPDGR